MLGHCFSAASASTIAQGRARFASSALHATCAEVDDVSKYPYLSVVGNRVWPYRAVRADARVFVFISLQLSAASSACSRHDEPVTAAPTPSYPPPAPTASLPASPTTAAPSDAVVISAGVRASCVDICDRSRQLKCKHAEQCMSNCLGMASTMPCGPFFMGFYQCLRQEPLPHWECSNEGIAVIREGFCDQEQARAVRCMEEKMQP